MKMTGQFCKDTDINLNWLDFLRVFAMLLVLMLHVSQRINMAPMISGLFNRMGCAGVAVFLVLSGYLIPDSYARCDSVGEFYLRRAFRIFPVYYVIVFANFLFRAMPVDDTGIGWIRYFLGINMIVPAYERCWNSWGGLWTISIFILYYLLMPLLSKICTCLKKSAIFCAGLSIFSILILKVLEELIADKYDMIIVQNSFVRMLPVILMGTIAKQAIQESLTQKVNFFIAIYMMVLGTIDVLNNFFFFGAVCALIIVNMEALKIRITQRVDFVLKKIARQYSFLIYMIHLSILDLLEMLGIKERFGTITYIFGSLILIIVISIALHYIVEKSFIMLEQKIIKRPKGINL